MKKTAIAMLTATLLSTSAFAADVVNTATANFQWGGVIPQAEITNPDVCIDNTGALDHMNGVLEFSNDGSAIALEAASELRFKVMDNNCGLAAEGETAPVSNNVAYGYELKRTQVSIGGLAKSDYEWLYVVDESGTALSEPTDGTKTRSKDAGEETMLTVKSDTKVEKATTLAEYNELNGQDVLVLAVLEVTTTTSTL